MIDNFSILLSHGLLLFAFWKMLNRPDLDEEAPPEPYEDKSGVAQQLAKMRARRRPNAPGQEDERDA